MIDEARTPLIIGSLGDKAIEKIVATYRWAAEVGAAVRRGRALRIRPRRQEGRADRRRAGSSSARLPKPEIAGHGRPDRPVSIHRAGDQGRSRLPPRPAVRREPRQGEIVIVDENTGRLAEGRKWRDGIHQAIEAKERIEVTVPTGQAARITVQDLFLRYKHLAGMTGTAMPAGREFRKVYHKVGHSGADEPARASGKRLPDLVFGTRRREVAGDRRRNPRAAPAGPAGADRHAVDRQVGASSRSCSTRPGIEHKVLNAHEIAAEAEIVARAGQPGKVTVATNMAGRGTDIKLGPGVAELGGLHVICTELHDSARIDRQLMGRCGRQGDPGTVRQYMSLDDDVIRTGFGPETAEKMTALGKQPAPTPQQATSACSSGPSARSSAATSATASSCCYHEKERKKMQREMGQDPYLDTPD